MLCSLKSHVLLFGCGFVGSVVVVDYALNAVNPTLDKLFLQLQNIVEILGRIFTEGMHLPPDFCIIILSRSAGNVILSFVVCQLCQLICELWSQISWQWLSFSTSTCTDNLQLYHSIHLSFLAPLPLISLLGVHVPILEGIFYCNFATSYLYMYPLSWRWWYWRVVIDRYDGFVT
jgi:hypothetical protein